MITPLDYGRKCSLNSLEFATHCGMGGTWFYAADCEHSGDGWTSEHAGNLDSLLSGRVGSDPCYLDEDDGSFTIPFGRVLGQSSRRFSP